VIVPNISDKTPEAPSSSELNPLTNPVLEKHLGRWAKVYFSTPPAKREQAVNKLLEELKRESVVGAEVDAQPSRPYFPRDGKFERAVCAACHHQNPPGHKFCSRCGQLLSPVQPPSMQNPGATGISEALPPNSANEGQWVYEQTFSGLSDSGAPQRRGWKYLLGAAVIVAAGFAYVQWASGPRTSVPSATAPPQTSAPATAAPPANSAPAAPSTAETIAPKSISPEPVAPGPVAQGSVAPESVAPSSVAQSTVTPGSVAPSSVAPASVASGSVAPGIKDREVQNQSTTAGVHRRTVVPTPIQPASRKSPLLDAAASRQTIADEGSGGPDLRLAQRYLGGGMGGRDPSEAAKLLWKAVRKENATAAILLSDLYLRGDGVSRSCDQARLLLVAASKRGSPLAAQQLRNLESHGCR
jgi:hypothetical protein